MADTFLGSKRRAKKTAKKTAKKKASKKVAKKKKTKKLGKLKKSKPSFPFKEEDLTEEEVEYLETIAESLELEADEPIAIMKELCKMAEYSIKDVSDYDNAYDLIDDMVVDLAEDEESGDEESGDEEVEEEEPPKTKSRKSKPSLSNNSIFITGKEIDEELKRQETLSQQKFKPTFFLRDGDEKTVRFRDNEPLFSMWVHDVKRNGKWDMGHPCTKGTSVECQYCKQGLRPRNMVVYEVINRTPFKNKEGETITDKPAFYEMSAKWHKAIQSVAKRVDITEQDIGVSRMGSGSDTTYTFIPLGPSDCEALEEEDRLEDDITEYYDVEDIDHQKAVLGIR